MKNKIAITIMIFLMCLLVSCRSEEPKVVKEINSDFTVSNHIKSDYLYQQSSKLLITGNCEVGGTLVATLYSAIGVEVASEMVEVDKTGNYEISLSTPNGSFDEYKLEVRDYHNKYVKTYTNILFGEVHLLLGDHLIHNDFTSMDTNGEEDNQSFYYLDFTNPTNNWVCVDPAKAVKSFSYELYSMLVSTSKFDKCPIGFINVTYPKTLIEEWLPLEYANKSSSVVSFLNSTGKYYENPYLVGQMSYVTNNILSNLYNYSFSTITLSFGVNEFNEFYGKYNSDNYYNAYAKMLLYVIRNIEDNFFNYNELALIQTDNVNVNNINVLRNIQAQVSNYSQQLLLIPTYDLIETTEESFDSLLANRYYDIVYGKKVISEYANHFIDENEHIVTIELSKSTLFKFDFENIKVYDENGNLIELEEDKIKGRFNQIIIDLSYEIIDETDEEEPVKTAYYHISRIDYAQDLMVSGGIVYNNNNLPVIPFTISFE